jgi:predicted Zn-dependent peptidase
LQVANGPAASDEDRYAGRLLTTIVGDETGSRMFWKLVDTGLAEVAALGSYEYQGTGVFMTFLCCAPDEAATNLQIVRDLFREVEHRGVTEEELHRAKSKICSHLVLQSERPSNRLFSVGNGWLQRREYRTVREAVQSYQAVTTRDIAAVLEKYPFTASTTVAIGPLEKLAPPT